MSSLSPTLRIARDVDVDAIRRIYVQVFEHPGEARFVDSMRGLVDCPQLSMVAEVDGEVSGHILLSEIQLQGNTQLKIMALAPMAVVPKCQGFGVGSAMINVAIEQVRRRGYHAIIVIGLPDYYPRFGFRSLSEYGWQCPFEVDPTSILVAPLTDGPLHEGHEVLDYPAPFSQLFKLR
ncbi:GNAT family N-acetyltransferase [Celerinatantimonas sp. YJH-8]|uniref:GNAT family N-acetyltransferase n=1 Tax=Celerinatantimonas sp. YJH-8 TaxID=3228714 RepID=UPI0038C2DD60